MALANAHAELEQLQVAASSVSVLGMSNSVRSVAERVHQLKSHCDVTLVNDALRSFHSAQAIKTTSTAELNAVSHSDRYMYFTKNTVLCRHPLLYLVLDSYY